MATENLYNYQHFKQDRQSSLPNCISQLTIDAVNKEVITIASVQSDDVSKMQGEYIKITAKDWATIGEYAAAICYFRWNEHFPNLKEASMHGWKNAYCKEVLIEELPQKC